ncbi:hypothetical protein [Candidatus Protochlamydia phocaeensis]|uniref:hypothetical protein n=1 Tax=Candidatus Protochlamydia phocaeensis TaxID=1414722 RepID=UPI0008384C5F|nr:hypothetical protein [Candidatus Protochlamydia phocaeensis]
MAQQSNIFDEAARKSRTPIKATSQNAAPAPQPSPFFAQQSEAKELSEFNPSTMTLKDVADMLVQVRRMHDELDRKLDEVYQKSGWSPKYIKDYLDNPNNFTAKQWGRLEEQRRALMNTLKTEEEKVEEAKKAKEPVTPPADSSKMGKERRGKMLGARRNWISMR